MAAPIAALPLLARSPLPGASRDLIIADGASADLLPLYAAARLPLQLIHEGQLDPLATISASLRQAAIAAPIHTLHIVAHGRPGAISIAGQQLDRLALLRGAAELAQWRVERIVLWSCQAGADPGFVAVFQELSGAQVFASEQIIGHGQAQAMLGVDAQLSDLFASEALNGWRGTLNTIQIVDVQGGDLKFNNAIKLTQQGETELSTTCLYKNVYSGKDINGNNVVVDALVTFCSAKQAKLAFFDNPSQQYDGTDLFQPSIDIIPDDLEGEIGGSAKFLFNFVLSGSVETALGPNFQDSLNNAFIDASGTEVLYNGNTFYTPLCLRNVSWTSYDLDSYTENNNQDTFSSRQFTKTNQFDDTKLVIGSALERDTSLPPGELCIAVTDDNFDATDPPGSPQFDKYKVAVGMQETTYFSVELGDLSYVGPGYLAFFALDFGPQDFGTPELLFSKDVVVPANAEVPAFTPVTFEYSVEAKGGSFSGTSVRIVDDNATPDIPEDDFGYDGSLPDAGQTIKPVLDLAGIYNIGDRNSNGQIDSSEVWKYQATVIPPIQMDVTIVSSTGQSTVYDSGVITWKTLANGDVRVMYRQANAFNDNTYGTGSDAGWAAIGKTHTFSNLTGSDKAGFDVYYSDGTKIARFYQDYITASRTASGDYSGYRSLGFSGGDGSFISGNRNVFKDFSSTLQDNLNRPGGYTFKGSATPTPYTKMIVNSPTANAVLVDDPNWNQVNGYDFTIDASAFSAGKQFGGAFIFDQHNSPAKTGRSNTYIPTIRYGGSTNTAVVKANLIGDGTEYTNTDSATVNIISQAPPVTPVKFYVVDNNDNTYTYDSNGGSIGNWKLNTSYNKDPRDVAANAAGDKLWVVDKNKTINLYESQSGNWTWKLRWTASSLGKDSATGVTYDNFNNTNAIWTSDSNGAISWYNGGGANTNGSSKNANFTHNINPGSGARVTGIVTDGNNTLFAVIDTSGTDQIRRFTINRSGDTPISLTETGSWSIGNAGTPTGITLDPNQSSSGDLWIVADGIDEIWRFAGARGASSGGNLNPSTKTKLASGNSSPQGIADPDPIVGYQLNDGLVNVDSDEDFAPLPSYGPTTFRADPVIAPRNSMLPAGHDLRSFMSNTTWAAKSSFVMSSAQFRGVRPESWLNSLLSANPFPSFNAAL